MHGDGGSGSSGNDGGSSSSHSSSSRGGGGVRNFGIIISNTQGPLKRKKKNIL